MPKLKKGTIMPTDEEDQAINAGIAQDPDTHEWTDEDSAKAKTFSEAFPEEAEEIKRTRGPQKKPTKKPVSIRLDEEVIEYFKNNGKEGWQTQANKVLVQYVRSKSQNKKKSA